MDADKVNICGIQIDNVTREDVLKYIEGSITEKRSGYLVTANIDHIVKLQQDTYFRDIYSGAGLVLPDGMPLLWASKFLGNPLREKVSGSDLAVRICALSAKKGYRIFFLGGREGAAEGAAEKMAERYPGINIAGTYSPPFGFENDREELNKIRDIITTKRPDILLVGLGAPKQEKWIYENYNELGIPVSIGVGCTFEFMAGMVKRAPVFMQNIGMEWFWRLMMEPARLWKRYLVDDIKFFRLVYLQKMGR